MLATCHAPRWTAYAASASCGQPTSGAKPCATASGSSSADVTTVNPAARTAVTSPAPPTTSTLAPGCRRVASTPAAACAAVMTSSGAVGMPRPVSWSATDSGSRDALLVTNTRRIPIAGARVRPSAAFSIGS